MSVLRITLLPPDACEHPRIVPTGGGWGRCVACGDESFPMTDETSGRWPCCGGYFEHLRDCTVGRPHPLGAPVRLADAAPGEVLRDRLGRFWTRRESSAEPFDRDGFRWLGFDYTERCWGPFWRDV